MKKNRKKILVVDDDVDILDAVKDLLEMEGYEVQVIEKGEEAKSTIKQFLPDVVLLDLLLSGKDGSEICRELKSDSKVKNIPVIMMSAHPNAREQAIAAGADEFIEKPFEAEELFERISTITSS